MASFGVLGRDLFKKDTNVVLKRIAFRAVVHNADRAGGAIGGNGRKKWWPSAASTDAGLNHVVPLSVERVINTWAFRQALGLP